MKIETRYEQWKLCCGVCSSCGEESDEILIGDGRCVDCIEAENFYNKSMENYEEISFKNF